MPGRKIFHYLLAIFLPEGHQVESKGNILRIKRNPHAGCLKGRPTAITDGRIVPEHGKVGDITPGRKPLWDSLGKADLPFTSEAIHVRGMSTLQWSFPPEFGHRLIGHAVS
jgi:hypothetical protein